MNKILNKKGSVLFLVVVVMALLLVAASATYYVVRNQHMSANTHYNSEQSYQTAYSVSETVSQFIDTHVSDIAHGRSSLSAAENKLIAQMLNLPVGGLISDVDLKEFGMGNATVTIEKDDAVGGAAAGQVFKITTTATVNGETTTLVLRKRFEMGESSIGGGDYFTRFLTSTGKRQEDVLLSSHSLLSEVYFENDYTVLGMNGQMKVSNSIYCSGTLRDSGIEYNSDSPAEELVIYNDFYADSLNQGTINVEKIYVGGDFHNSKAIGDHVKEVYVLGNYYDTTVGSDSETTFYINGDAHIGGRTPNSTFYINGDLYLETGAEPNNGYIASSNNGKFYVNGNVSLYFDCGEFVEDFTGTVKELKYGGERIDTGFEFVENVWKNHIEKVSSAPSLFIQSKYNEIYNYISFATTRHAYNEWNAENLYLTKKDPGGQTVIRLDDDTLDEVTKLGNADYPSGWRVRIDKSCTIVPAKNVPHDNFYLDWEGNPVYYPSDGWRWGEAPSGNIIVIDASKEDIYIRLAPDIDDDGNVAKGTFRFMPTTYVNQWGSVEGNDGTVDVLIKGEHSVIFILPDGVSFDIGSFNFIGHYDLAMALTGKSGIGNDTENEDTFYAATGYNISNALPDSSTAAAKVDNFLVTEEQGLVKLDKVAIDKAVGYTTSVHNNIFLVSSSYNCTLYFDPSSTFFGYIYAPNSVMDASSQAGGKLNFIGGLIVGTYNYGGASTVLCFTTPYDYYGDLGTDIVNDLMRQAGGTGLSGSSGGGGGGSSGGSGVLGVTNLGYT